MESKAHENRNPSGSVRNAATLMEYYPDSTRLESKTDKQRKSYRHLSFVVEWQMYNHLSGNTSAKK